MDLAIQNPWWSNSAAINDDDKVKQVMEKEIKVLYSFKDDGNRLFLGPRQVGKTSMLKLLIYDLIINKKKDPRDILYFSCEPLNTKNDLIDLFNEFEKTTISNNKKYLFLDEVTQIPDWELAIKYFLETTLSRNKTLYATGSNALLLKKGIERLPGRNIKTQLFLPLTFRQFLDYFGSKKLQENLKSIMKPKLGNLSNLDNSVKKLIPFSAEIEKKFMFYLKTGGYIKPIYELSENNNITAETYEIYVRWILGDLNKLNRKEKIFKNIITGIIKNYTSKFSLHAIAKETEIKSHITVGEYVDDLQSLLLCNILYQAEINKKISLYRKERKCYFFDPFLFSVFSGYIKGRYQDYSEESKDKIIEGIVCETLNRVVRNDFDTSSYLWFFVKKKETDFVINQNDGLIGVELKYSNKVQFNDFNNFSMFKTRIILSKKDFNFNEYKNTIIIPVHLFLSLIK